MMTRRAFASICLLATSLYACAAQGTLVPSNRVTHDAHRPSAAPTPFPLPKHTPNWGIVEKAAPWDFTSTGPDRTGCGAHEGLTYRVGPNQPYPEPHNVPWLRLLPCDTVLIYPAPAPYSDLIYIASRGRVHKAITISGVLDSNGHRPILDGSHALTSAAEGVDPYLLCDGMITVGKPSVTAEESQNRAYKPGYLIIENFEIRNAFGKYPGSHQPTYTCTDLKGAAHPWPEFASGIAFDPAEHVTIRNMYLHNNGLGAFVNSVGNNLAQSRDFYVTGNTILDNGNGNAGLHNFYFEVIGERVIHNYFGPPIVNTQGENVKDRSVCMEWSDNYIDTGNHLLTFRDPQSNAAFESKQIDAFGQPCAGEIYVHGNTLVSRGPTVYQAMSEVVGFGDGTLDGPIGFNRFGSVYFYNNTVVAVGNKDNYDMKAAVVFDNVNTLKPTTFYAINNLFYSMPQSKGHQAPFFAACGYQRSVDFTQNWDSEKMLVKFLSQANDYTGPGALPCDGSGMGGITVAKNGDPGFVNAAGGDFHLTSGSPFYAQKGALPSAVIQRHLQPDGVQYPTPSP